MPVAPASVATTTGVLGLSILAGLNVIEISEHGAAAMAAKQVAAWGARVTIFEPPGERVSGGSFKAFA